MRRKSMFIILALLLSVILTIPLGTVSYAADDSNPTEIPSAYSSVTAGVITSAREQYGGTCVLYTSGAAAESSLIINGDGRFDNVTTDLSETQMIYNSWNDQLDPLGNSTGDRNTCNSSLAANPFVSTDHMRLMLSYANWASGATEAQLPCNEKWQASAKAYSISDYDAHLGNVAHLQNAYVVPFKSEQDRDAGKQMIMKYGSMGAIINVDDADYNPEYAAYYTEGTKTNHSIAIVGWNDKFPREYFCGPDGKHALPEHDGAWLMKNSHGTSFGTDGDCNPANSGPEGYCWVSYEDESLGSNGYIYDFYPADTYDYNYQYDGTTSLSTTYLPEGTTVGATYTVKGLTSSGERISAVGLGINSVKSSGTIRIYVDSTFGQPESGYLAAVVPFTTKYNGFHTIEIPDGPVVEKGHNYTVSVQFDKATSLRVDAVVHDGMMNCDPDFSHDRTFRVDTDGTFTNLADQQMTARVKVYTNDVEDEKYPIINDTFYIKLKGSDETGFATPGTEDASGSADLVFQQKSSDAEGQKFQIVYEEDSGTYMIVHCATRKLLTYDPENNSMILQTANSQSLLQRWRILSNKDGSVTICSAQNANIVVGLPTDTVSGAGSDGDQIPSVMLEQSDEYADSLLVFPRQCSLEKGDVVTVTLKDGSDADFVVLDPDMRFGADRYVYLFSVKNLDKIPFVKDRSIAWDDSCGKDWCVEFYEKQLPEEIKAGIVPLSGPNRTDYVSFPTKVDVLELISGDLEPYRKADSYWWTSDGSVNSHYYNADGTLGTYASATLETNKMGCRPAFVFRADLLYETENSDGKYTLNATHVVPDADGTEEPEQNQGLLKPSTAKVRVYIRAFDVTKENGMVDNAYYMGEQYQKAFPNADVRVSVGTRTNEELWAEFDALFTGSDDDTVNIVNLNGHGSPIGTLFVANKQTSIYFSRFKEQMDNYKGTVYFQISGCYAGQWIDGESHPAFMEALDDAGNKYHIISDSSESNLYSPFSVGPAASITGKWSEGLTITADEDGYSHITADINGDGVLTPYELMMYGGTSPYAYEAVIYPAQDDSHFLELPFRATFHTGNAGAFPDGSDKCVVLAEGNTVTASDDPVSNDESTVFAGWYTSYTGGEAVKFPLPLAHNVDLYARWLRNGEETGYDKEAKSGDIVRVPYKNGSYCDYIILDAEHTNDGNDGMFLIAKGTEGKTTFDKDLSYPYWAPSQARKWCEEYFSSKFTLEIAELMPGSAAEIGSSVYEDNLREEKVFFVSKEEAETYMTVEQRSGLGRWWTRSGDYYQNDGTAKYFLSVVTNDEMSARPAINLSLSKEDLKYVADKDYFLIKTLINVEAEPFEHVDKTYYVTKNGEVIYTASGERDAACDHMNTLAEVPWSIDVPTAYKNDVGKIYTLAPGKYKGMPYSMQWRDCYDIDNLEEAFKDGLQGLDCSSSTSYALRYATGRDILIYDNTAYRTRNFVGDAQNVGHGAIPSISGGGGIPFDDYVTIVGDYGDYKYGKEINTQKLITNIKELANYSEGSIYDHVYAKMKPGDILVRHFYTSSGDVSSHTQLVTGVSLVYNGDTIDPDQSRVYYTDTSSPNRTVYRVGGETTAWANDNTLLGNSMTFTACANSSYVIPITLNEWKAQEPAFTEGNNSSWMQGDSENMTFRVNVPASDITKILVDDAAVDAGCAEYGDGETEITLSADYLSTLELGRHVIKVYTKLADLDANFSVVRCTHKHTRLDNAKEATCSENGYSGDLYCLDCGQLAQEGSVIPKKEHETELRDFREATETSDGYTGDKYCTVCGELAERGNFTPKIGLKAYTVSSGVNSVWQKGSTSSLAFFVEAPKAAINSIWLDGTLIGSYSYTPGSTYTGYHIPAAKLEKLSGGQHVFRAKLADGEALAQFFVLDPEVDSCVHTDTTVTDKADCTCTRDGYTGDTYCTVCHELIKKGEVIPASGHEPVLRSAKTATFEEDGYTGDSVCKNCGTLLRQGSVIPKLTYRITVENGSTWRKGSSRSVKFVINMSSADVVDGEIDGHSYGYTKYLGSNCGILYSSDTLERLSLGTHTFTIIGKNATVSTTFEVIECDHSSTETYYARKDTCNTDGYTGDTYCSICGKLMEKGSVISAAGHTEERINQKNATYTEDGYTGDVVCTVCGETLKTGSVIPKLVDDIEAVTGSTWIKGSTGSLTFKVSVPSGDIQSVWIDKTSISYGYTMGSPTKITVYTSTLEKQAVGPHKLYIHTRNGTIETSFVIIPCDHSNTELRGAADAACTENGYTGDKVCTICGKTLEEGTIIPATGHTKELAGEKAATCTETGYTGDTVCTICGKTLEEGTVIPAAGHTKELAGEKAATCTETGYTGDTVCMVCGEALEEGTVIPAAGHTKGIAGEKAATCTEDGYTGNTVCTVCGDVLAEGSVIPAKGHEPETTGVKAAAYDSDGYTGDSVCSICGKVLETGKVIPRLPYTVEAVTGSTWMKGSTGSLTFKVSVSYSDVQSVRIDKTFISYGYTMGSPTKITVYTSTLEKQAVGPHKLYIHTGNGMIETDFEVIPCDHSDTELRGAVDATCTEPGYTGDKVCTICGETLEKSTIIPATGHTKELAGEKAVTCTEPGYTGDTVCAVCGKTLEEGTVIPAAGHTKGLVGEKAATCTEPGYTGDTVCTVCGEVFQKGSAIPAAGHSEGTIGNNDGTHGRICAVCGMILSTEPCYDKNADGSCDVCGAALRRPENFRKVNAFTPGRSYLILSGGNALKSELSAEALLMSEARGVFVPDKQTDGSILWMFDAGKLYCVVDNTVHYLTFDADNRLIVTTDKGKAAQWNITSGCLATQAPQKPGKKNKTVNWYLALGESGFTLSTTKAPIEVYEKLADETETTYVLKKADTIQPTKPALIMADSRALRSDLSAASIEISQNGAAYTTTAEIRADLLWYFEAGKLYSRTDEGEVYLTINAANKLTLTSRKADAVNWTIRDGRISTDVVKRTGKKGHVTTYYLYCNGSAFEVNSSGSRISFYQQ